MYYILPFGPLQYIQYFSLSSIRDSFMTQSGGGGWGYIIRDSRGDVICAGAGKLRHLREAIRFEVRACYEGEKAAAASRGIGCDTPDKLPHLDTNYQGQFI